MSLEGLKSVFEIGGVVLLGLTFVFGAGALITSNRINALQSKELGEFKLKTAEAQAEAANAQLALKQYVDVVAKSGNPRHLDPKRFLELLKGKPKGIAEIWYEPDDEEAREFASQLHRLLGAEGAGWSVREIRSLPVNWSGTDLTADQITRLKELETEASTGLAIGSNKLSPFDVEGKTALGALTNAINFATGGWNISGIGGHWQKADPTLLDDHFVLVVGHHRVNVPLVEFGPRNK